MQYLPPLQPIHEPKANRRPRLDSLDSSQEFSLDHLVEVLTLVEKEECDLDGYVFDDSCLFVSQ
jgi:hypothetical protein